MTQCPFVSQMKPDPKPWGMASASIGYKLLPWEGGETGGKSVNKCGKDNGEGTLYERIVRTLNPGGMASASSGYKLLRCWGGAELGAEECEKCDIEERGEHLLGRPQTLGYGLRIQRVQAVMLLGKGAK